MSKKTLKEVYIKSRTAFREKRTKATMKSFKKAREAYIKSK